MSRSCPAATRGLEEVAKVLTDPRPDSGRSSAFREEREITIAGGKKKPGRARVRPHDEPHEVIFEKPQPAPKHTGRRR